MISLFGKSLSHKELNKLVPDVTRVAGIRQFREDNGAASDRRLIRIESGGGLSVELLPDRALDIGQVWCNGIPFAWTGPIGNSDPGVLGTNTPLTGLMTTCGFEHIRHPETEDGVTYPQHGSMMHQPATLLRAAPVWAGESCVFRIEAAVTQFSLQTGAIRLCRQIEIPLGGRAIALTDRIEVLSGEQELMAMYHVNLGYPLSGPETRLTLDGTDITEESLGSDGVQTRTAGSGIVTAEMAASRDGGSPRFRLSFDADMLPVFQTLRNSASGINLTCLEPASHDRKPRSELRTDGTLKPARTGSTLIFRLGFEFESGDIR